MSILAKLQADSAEFDALMIRYNNGTASPIEKLTLLNLTSDINRLINQSFAEHDVIITKISELSKKKAAAGAKWTPSAQAELDKALADSKEYEDAVIDTSGVASLAAQAASLRKQIVDDNAVKKAAEEGVVMLSFNGFSDYMTFIRNTQYLNPYRRNRACDDTFRDLIMLLKDTNSDAISELKTRAEYLKKQLAG